MSCRFYLLQRPEDNREREGYARAQEDGLRDDREEELGLGRPAGRSQRTSTSPLRSEQWEEAGRLEKTLEPRALQCSGRRGKGNKACGGGAHRPIIRGATFPPPALADLCSAFVTLLGALDGVEDRAGDR